MVGKDLVPAFHDFWFQMVIMKYGDHEFRGPFLVFSVLEGLYLIDVTWQLRHLSLLKEFSKYVSFSNQIKITDIEKNALYYL